jgi:GTP-binding protein EngB required for normal cell division
MPGITVEDAGNGSSDSNPQRTEPVSHGARSLLVDQLQSRDHAELLSAIDRLRQEHIDKVKIPQIVVCGNQSSGKSSVLEAIAGVAFPIGSGTVTKFATEVILRKSSEERRRARIIASSEREGNLRRRIEEFERSFDSSTSVDFGRVITEAGNHLLQLEPNAGFWKDWLQIEIIGPSQPHLTLVDLPGIIQYDSDDPENAQKITGLLSTYVENPRTTVLAIIDALNNYQNQGILNIITETARDRTLGVITKTDRLSETDDIQNVISLAKNESVTLRLGWHVLRNLSHQDQDRSPARRDELERQFFARRDWSVLPRCDVGIESLRSKLSDQLLRSITIQLPGPDGLIANMRQQLHQCRSELRMLGPSRVTVLEQRTYLFDILNSLSRLIEDALDGDYEKEGFESFFGNSKDKRLRDKIRLETEDFVSQMELRGKQYHVSIRPDETGERLA